MGVWAEAGNTSGGVVESLVAVRVQAAIFRALVGDWIGSVVDILRFLIPRACVGVRLKAGGDSSDSTGVYVGVGGGAIIGLYVEILANAWNAAWEGGRGGR